MNTHYQIYQDYQNAVADIDPVGPVGPTDPVGLIELSIVSNSQLLCEGLMQALAAHILMHCVGSYPSVVLHEQINLPNPVGHIVLLDGDLGRDATVAWTHYWRRLQPPAGVLVMEL